MLRRVWEVVEAKAGEFRMAEAKERRDKERSRKETRKIEKEKATEEEDSERMEDLEGGRRSSKIRRGDKEISPQKVLSVDKNVWQETIGENAHAKNLEPCHQHERRICAKEEESIPDVKRRKRGGAEVYTGATEERIHLILQVTSNGASVLCRKEEWKKEDGTELSVSQ